MALTARFETFGAQHLVLLALFVVVAVGIVVLARRWRGADDRRFRRVFALVILSCTVPFQVAQLLPGDFELGTSLPLNLSDLAWIAAAYALWTRRLAPVALTYYWGLTLTVQSIITPSLAESFPDLRFFGFWTMHLLTVWAALYLAASGNWPTWRGYRITMLATAAWAVLAIGFNTVTGTNYGYLNAKPRSASVLDLFGPWPLYVVVEVLVLAAGWALITWPWVRAGRRRARSREGSVPDAGGQAGGEQARPG